jgi:hypothetical protein
MPPLLGPLQRLALQGSGSEMAMAGERAAGLRRTTFPTLPLLSRSSLPNIQNPPQTSRSLSGANRMFPAVCLGLLGPSQRLALQGSGSEMAMTGEQSRI